MLKCAIQMHDYCYGDQEAALTDYLASCSTAHNASDSVVAIPSAVCVRDERLDARR